MTEHEMVVAVVAITAGTIFAGAVFYKIVDLIKTWVNRKNTSINEEEFDRLAQAFIKYKKETEQRIRQLEAIAGEQSASTEDTPSQKRITLEEPEKKSPGGRSSLENMLRKQS